jgi:hypothetical protein
VIDGTPKTRTSVRRVWLDDESITLLREHRKAQLAARLALARPGRTTT